jgi:hypothetical protein
MTQPPKNGYDIWHLECLEALRIGSLTTVVRVLGKYMLDLVGVQDVRWENGGTGRAEDNTFPYGEGNWIIS